MKFNDVLGDPKYSMPDYDAYCTQRLIDVCEEIAKDTFSCREAKEEANPLLELSEKSKEQRLYRTFQQNFKRTIF